MYKHHVEVHRLISKAEREMSLEMYERIRVEKEKLLHVFDLLKRIRDTSKNDKELGKNIRIFLKNK